MSIQRLLYIIIITLFLTYPCLANDPLLQEEYLDNQAAMKKVNDPWESFNRKMFSFNDKFIKHVMTPIAKGYNFVIHKRMQKSVNNLYGNIHMPIRFFSCVFQGKFTGATTEMGRFIMNSTLGIGGLFDPALKFAKLQNQDEDFGQVFAFHGASNGNYIVLPFLGPSTLRDSIGRIFDAAFDPLTWVGIYKWVDPQEAILDISALEKINYFAYKGQDQYNDFLKSAIDPYIASQDAYLQNRENKIKN